MSGPCNKCNLASIRRRMKKAGKKVEVKPRACLSFPEGKDVLVDGEFTVWYAEIPAECGC